jgi:hypothetical protein
MVGYWDALLQWDYDDYDIIVIPNSPKLKNIQTADHIQIAGSIIFIFP